MLLEMSLVTGKPKKGLMTDMIPELGKGHQEILFLYPLQEEIPALNLQGFSFLPSTAYSSKPLSSL